MIELYTWNTPNGRKISIALEEMALDYRAIPVDITNEEQFAPDFLAISPNNKIPAIRDGELALFESGAILLYLARKCGRFLPPEGTLGYWRTLEWLMWQTGGYGPMLGQAHQFLHYNPGKSAYAEARYRDEARRLYGVLDRHLARSAYLTDEPSVADFAVWPWTARHAYHQIDLHDFPHVLRWYRELAARPGFVRGYAQPGDVEPIPLPD